MIILVVGTSSCQGATPAHCSSGWATASQSDGLGWSSREAASRAGGAVPPGAGPVSRDGRERGGDRRPSPVTLCDCEWTSAAAPRTSPPAGRLQHRVVLREDVVLGPLLPVAIVARRRLRG